MKKIKPEEDRLLQIERTLASIDKTLALNTHHLAEHMRRTQLLEDDMGPVKKHVEQMKGAAKLLGLIALVASIIAIFR